MTKLGSRRRWVAAVLAGLAVTAAACGSTLPHATQDALERASASGGSSEQGVAPNGVGPGNAPSSSGGPLPTSGPGGQAGAGGASGLAAISGGGGGSSGSAGGSGGVGGSGPTSTIPVTPFSIPPSTGVNGPGVTATTINVATAYDASAAAEDAAIGAGNAGAGNTMDEENAAVNYINAHGGVDHRKINLVTFDVNGSDSADEDDQQGCTYWTQDNKVFVLSGGTPILDQCAATAHALGLGELILGEDTAILHQYPADIDLTGFTINRGMRATVNGLAKQGYFSSKAKVGLVTWDEGDYQYGIDNGADPALAALGLHDVPVQYVTVPASYGDLAATTASINSAVLRFQSEGIDHVILFDGSAGINSSGVLVLLWLTRSYAQGYHPIYGLNSTSGFSTLASDYPKSQMLGSLGVGWVPSLDLDASDYAALPQSAAAKLCLSIMSAAGQAATSATDQSGQFEICDFLFFLQQALAGITGPLNVSTALAAIDSVGTSYPVISTFGIDLSASQHDGAELVRDTAYVSSCNCYRYTSPPYNPG